MQVILLEKIGGLGELGDVVRVKDGYARNFLIPQRKVQRATEENLAIFQQRRAELEARQAKILEEAKAQQAQIQDVVLTISQKSGVDGRLFGSVNHHDIIAALKNDHGITLERNSVRLPDGPFKMTGEYEVTVVLAHDVHAQLKLIITAAL